MLGKLTPKQDKLIDIMVDNALQKNKTKTKRKMLLEAGYTKPTTTKPSEILDSSKVQAELQIRTAKTIKKMEEMRALTIAQIPKKINKAPYNHLVNGVDIFTKNIQLLSGKATENKAINIQISEHIALKNTQ